MSTVGAETETGSVSGLVTQEKSPVKTQDQKKKRDGHKKGTKRNNAVDELTAEEREAVTIVFHQYETGLREGTIFTKVINS